MVNPGAFLVPEDWSLCVEGNQRPQWVIGGPQRNAKQGGGGRERRNKREKQESLDQD